MNTQLTVTIQGKDLNELIAGAQKFVAANQATSNAAPVKTKKTAAPVEEPEADELDLETAEAEETDELDFDSETEDEEVEEQPKAKKKTAGAKKLTEKDMNAIALAHAKANGGRAATLKVLTKHFKVKSLLELKPEQYAKAAELLAV